MKKRRQIDLLLPGLFWDTAIRQLNDLGYRPRNLERVLNRSRQCSCPAQELTDTLFQLFGTAKDQSHDLPAGAVTAWAFDLPSDEGCWALATPVHLLADRDRLILIRLASQSIQSDYAERLISQFNTHFQADGLTLIQLTPNQWCLKLSKLPDISTSSIELVAGKHLEAYQPTGADAADWRKLLNEAQMLFFQDEVSQTKMASGEPSINAVWFSGFGTCPAVQADYVAFFGSHTLLSGLSKLGNIANPDLPADLSDTLEENGPIAILVTDLLEAELDADMHRWETALTLLDTRLNHLFKAVDFGVDQLSIYTCQGQRYDLRKGASIFNLFRKDKCLYQLMEGCG